MQLFGCAGDRFGGKAGAGLILGVCYRLPSRIESHTARTRVIDKAVTVARLKGESEGCAVQRSHASRRPLTRATQMIIRASTDPRIGGKSYRHRAASCTPSHAWT